ncbi:MAG: AAA family ATPase [Proteobacteria bacterium]|nr:AAA family ATPase [Pseudomonadota bacterium]
MMNSEDYLQKQTIFIADVLAWLQKTTDPQAELLQTHVSWVLLHGQKAWKIKKAIALPFLDYSTLDKRKHFCTREFELNRLSGGSLYLGVRTLSRRPDGLFAVDATGDIDEYIVEMNRFTQSALLSNLLAPRQNNAPDRASDDAVLGRKEIAALAAHIGQFHLSCPAADQAYGSFDASKGETTDNFEAVEHAGGDGRQNEILQSVKEKTLGELGSMREFISQRQAQGRIRLCHGDLHLGNLVWLEGQPLLFDRIEFSDDFAQVDVIKDLAFLYMDLYSYGHPQWAALLADVWAQTTGDYEGLALLRVYACYRAMVRAKIAAITSDQNPGDAAIRAQIWQRVDLASSFVRPEQNCLVLMHGTTGVGKSWYSARIAGALGGLQLHSDVIRKQLAGLPPDPVLDADVLSKLYTPASSKATYDRMLELASAWLAQGYSVVVDASFLARTHRRAFIDAAAQYQAQCLIATPQCSAQEQLQRLSQPRDDASDGNARVLQMQQASVEPLDESERAYEWRLHSASDLDARDLSPYSLHPAAPAAPVPPSA